MPGRTTRRTFVKSLAGAPVVISSATRGASATSKVNIGGIGVAGKGRGDISSTSKGQNVVALCDVDETLLRRAGRSYPGQKLEWNAAHLKVANLAEANQYVRRAYREGWMVKGLS